MSNGDKRSVSTDALETLGTIIDEGQGRDAIHLAVEPVTAGEQLSPGQHIGLINGRACSITAAKALGIVDPFLTNTVRPGQRFWLVVYPRQITSLRHVWAHPDFPEESATSSVPSPRELSISFIENEAREFGLGYNYFMSVINAYVDEHFDDDPQYGNHIVFGEDIDKRSVPDEFWQHYEIVSGRKVPEEWRKDVYFSCGC